MWDSSHIAHYWLNGGPLMGPITAVSFALWFHFLRLRRQLAQVAPPGFETRIADAVRQRPLDVVLADCRAVPGAIAAAVAYTLDAQRRREAPADAFAQIERTAVARLGRDLVIVIALTSAAPFLGLLGTVGGMIETFHAVAGGNRGETAARVSSGISQALIATQYGLAVAIPGLFCVARLERLRDRATLRFAHCRNQLLLALAARTDDPGSHHATVA